MQSHIHDTSAKIHEKFVGNFLSYSTDTQTNKGKNITSLTEVIIISFKATLSELRLVPLSVCHTEDVCQISFTYDLVTCVHI